VCCDNGPETVLFFYGGGPLADGILSLGSTPNLLPPGAPGTPKKVFPQFLKNFRSQGQNVECAAWGPPRGVCCENLVTVPWSVCREKIPNFVKKSNFSAHSKRSSACVLDPPMILPSGSSERWAANFLWAKNAKSRRPPANYRKSLERSFISPKRSGPEKFKKYLNELREFPMRKFLICCSCCGRLLLYQNSSTFTKE